jgi:hypothetical protein
VTNPFDNAAAAFAEPTQPKPVAGTATQGVVHHHDLEQGSPEWFAARCGLLTASEMKLIVTPATLKASSNDKERAHLFELLAQRITKYVEPTYIGDEMLRGYEDEIEARRLYSERIAPVHEVGFITNDRWGFTLGYSPDGLVGEHGQIECKSRRQKFHVQAVIENVSTGTCPTEFMLQVQTGLLVSERQWCDFIVFTGGLPMIPIRVYPDEAVQGAIVMAAAAFEVRLKQQWDRYKNALAGDVVAIPTERKVEEEMVI